MPDVPSSALPGDSGQPNNAQPNHPNHRLFVASVPPPEVVESLTGAVAPLRATAPSLRWAPPSQWHVTLAFLGPVDEETRPELNRRLGRVAARHTRVELGVSGGGRFGQRVLFAKIAGDLNPLAAGIRRAAQRAGVTGIDDRPLHAHLTLARVPERERVDLRDLVAALREATADCPPWTADDIVLFASTGGPHVTYHPLATWPLT
jgi:2'-5' RNA ligase